ncbi:hypothetical protein C8Q72DRAFT_798261 [Fomitopsis betulina]|nr:hypothetical protein C8Q72DRAFT_798261 [Fomitopsis betulina]
MLASLAKGQVKEIEKAPQDWLVIIPHATGAAIFKENPKLHTSIASFLRTFRMDNESTEKEEQILMAVIKMGRSTEVEAALLALNSKNPHTKDPHVYMPVPVGRKFKNLHDKFSKLWAMFAKGASEEATNYFLWQQTFAVNKTTTFGVLCIEDRMPSWVLANFAGNNVSPENEDLIMAKIKTTLWHDDAYHEYVHRALTIAGVPGNINDHTVRATQSFMLTFFNNTTRLGKPATVVQLRGCPVPSKEQDNKNDISPYLVIIRGMTYWIADGMDVLTLAGKIDCKLCKVFMHPTYDCPFQQTEGWFGSEYDGAKRHKETVRKATVVVGTTRPYFSLYLYYFISLYNDSELVLYAR